MIEAILLAAFVLPFGAGMLILRHDYVRLDPARALFVTFATSIGLDRKEDQDDRTVKVLHDSGWTEHDVHRLAAHIKAATTCGGRNAAFWADRMFNTIGYGALPGTTPAEQEPWIVLWAAHAKTPITKPLMAPNFDTLVTAANIRRWHAALGPYAPHAVAAGLTLDEATAAHAAGTLDVDMLMAMSALRGVSLPHPVHTATTRHVPA